MDSVTRGSGIAAQRARRGDGQRPAVTARQARRVPGVARARPARSSMASAAATSSSGPPGAWIAARRQQPGRRPAGGRATPGVPCRRARTAAGPGPALTSLAGPARPGSGAGPARIMPSARSAPSSARVQAVIPIPRNPPGSALMSSNVMPCSTARSWPPSSRATQPGSPRPTTATRRASTPTASPCSPSPRTRPTPSRTRSSSPRRSFPRSATRTGSGPGCTRWPGMSAAGGSGPRAAPPRSTRRPEVTDDTNDLGSDLEQAELREVVWSALGGLTPSEREIIELNLGHELDRRGPGRCARRPAQPGARHGLAGPGSLRIGARRAAGGPFRPGSLPGTGRDPGGLGRAAHRAAA